MPAWNNSLRKFLPGVIVEPIVVYRQHLAVVEDGVNGLVVPTGDAHALAAAIQRLVDDPPPLRARLSGAASQRIMETFEMGRVIRRLVRIYRNLIPRKVYGSESCPQRNH